MNTPTMTVTRQDAGLSDTGEASRTRTMNDKLSPLSAKRYPMSDEEDDDVIDPAESKESSVADEKGRCDANMLMCGEVLEGGSGMGCLIM